METEVKTIDTNKVKVELYKSKVMAKFSHYEGGKLFYTVEMEDGKYLFPIKAVEERIFRLMDNEEQVAKFTGISLSSDLGNTSFNAEIKAASLNRWISMAIDADEFIKVG